MVWYGMVWWYTLFKSRNTLAPTTLSWFPWRACLYKYKKTKANDTRWDKSKVIKIAISSSGLNDLSYLIVSRYIFDKVAKFGNSWVNIKKVTIVQSLRGHFCTPPPPPGLERVKLYTTRFLFFSFTHTVFTRISPAALIKFLTPLVRRLFKNWKLQGNLFLQFNGIIIFHLCEKVTVGNRSVFSLLPFTSFRTFQ